MKALIFDTETTGLPTNWSAGPSHDGHPDLLQLGMLFVDENRYPIFELGTLVKPYRDYTIDPGAFGAHSITKEMCEKYGRPVDKVINTFVYWAKQADLIVCHNTSFDRLVLLTCAYRTKMSLWGCFDAPRTQICTMKSVAAYEGGKWPKLIAAYKKFVDPNGFPDAHNASADVWAATRILWALQDRGIELRGP